MNYSLFIFILLVGIYYSLCQIRYESFYIDDQKSKTRAVLGVKKKKNILKNSKKENVVVVVPSIDPEMDKKLEKMIKDNFSQQIVTVITFTDKNLISEFLSNVTPVIPTKFPAYYKINTSTSANNHMDMISDKPNITNVIDNEYRKLRGNKRLRKNEIKNEVKKNDKGVKKLTNTVAKNVPTSIKDVKDLGKSASKIGKKLFGKKK